MNRTNTRLNAAARRCLSLAVAGALAAGAAGCANDDDAMDGDMGSEGRMSPSDDGMATPAMARGDIIDVATGPGMSEVTTLVQAVQAADLVETLKGPGPFTVFAPTNAAFAKLPPGALDDLLLPENKEQLKQVLLYHVVPGKQSAAQVMAMSDAQSAGGGELVIEKRGGKVMLGNDQSMATVIKTDVPASNGVIHWIDTVLMPPM